MFVHMWTGKCGEMTHETSVLLCEAAYPSGVKSFSLQISMSFGVSL